jgi:hypothetical protein
MAYTAASALRKISSYQADDDLRLKRSYFFTTHLDHLGVGSSCSMEYPAAVCPPSARKFHYGMSGATLFSCLLSRQRHQEKWWLGGLFLSLGYFIAAKFDEAGAGIQGHNAGVLISVFGTLGLTCRVIAGSGNRGFNLKALALLWAVGWYEWGMVHQWTAYITHYKQEMSGRAKSFETSLWVEYVPQHIDPVFLHYHGLKTIKDATTASVAPTEPPQV